MPKKFGAGRAALFAPADENTYVANAIEVTYNVDRLDDGATFAADGETVSMSVWLRRNGNFLTRQFFWGGQATRWEVGFTTADDFNFHWFNAAGSTSLRLRSTPISDTNWHHYAVSIDTNGASASEHYLYVDGVLDEDTVDDTIVEDLNRSRGWSVGTQEAGTTLGFDGDFAEFWASSEFVDFSDSATLQKFRSAAGKPVDLGSDGSAPTGTAPEIYSKSAAASITTNSGSDANFTVGTGTFTDASTSPSD